MVLLHITHLKDEALDIEALPSRRSSSEMLEELAQAELVLRLGWLLLLLAVKVVGGRPVVRLRMDLRAAFSLRLFLMAAIFPSLLVMVAASKSADINREVEVAIVVEVVVVLLGVVDTAKVGECRVVER